MEAGVEFEVMPANVDERLLPGETAKDFVKRLSVDKALAISCIRTDCLVIGADTIVVLDGKIYGKPTDLADASRMLATLSARTHNVLTGVAFVRNGKILENWTSRSDVTFKQLNDNDIKSYIACVNPLDKAGSYGFQHHGDMIVEKFDGLKSNIIGLPIEEVMKKLDKFWRR